MIRVVAGYDPREAIGAHAFQQSLLDHSPRAALSWLCGDQKDGSNAFTYERFRLFTDHQDGKWVLFLDGSDMLLRSPLDDLWKLCDSRYAVMVVKHNYKTQHPRKYVGTEMESANADYPRKNWSSLMLVNTTHWSNIHKVGEIRKAIEEGNGAFLHRFSWLHDDEIGELPIEWNWLADEYGENQQAKLLHWTAGIPGFYHYRGAPHSEEWRAVVRKAMRGAA